MTYAAFLMAIVISQLKYLPSTITAKNEIPLSSKLDSLI